MPGLLELGLPVPGSLELSLPVPGSLELGLPVPGLLELGLLAYRASASGPVAGRVAGGVVIVSGRRRR